MKEIELSKNGTKYKGMYKAIVDDDIFDIVNKYNWNYHHKGYAIRYDYSSEKPKAILLHRFIYELKNGPIPEGLFIDHRDGNSLNDCISNLRLATQQQNNMNRKKNKNNTSGFKGICKHVCKGHPRKDGSYKEFTYWCAQVKKEKKMYSKCFPFSDEGLEQAKEWIKEMSLELHGKFSTFNKDK